MKIEIGRQYKNRRNGKIVTVTNITVHTDGTETQALVEYNSPDGSIVGLVRPCADEMVSFCERHETI
jgi:hypothetical protein